MLTAAGYGRKFCVIIHEICVMSLQNEAGEGANGVSCVIFCNILKIKVTRCIKDLYLCTRNY